MNWLNRSQQLLQIKICRQLERYIEHDPKGIVRKDLRWPNITEMRVDLIFEALSGRIVSAGNEQYGIRIAGRAPAFEVGSSVSKLVETCENILEVHTRHYPA